MADFQGGEEGGLKSENVWTKVGDLLREALWPLAWAFSEKRAHGSSGHRKKPFELHCRTPMTSSGSSAFTLPGGWLLARASVSQSQAPAMRRMQSVSWNWLFAVKNKSQSSFEWRPWWDVFNTKMSAERVCWWVFVRAGHAPEKFNLHAQFFTHWTTCALKIPK